MRSVKAYVLLIGGCIVIPFFIWQCRTTQVYDLQPLGVIPAPEDNLQTTDKVELGRKLFFDKRLSIDNTIACANCHIPEYAFTDRMRHSTGVEGRKTERNSPTLLNSAWLPTVMFDAHLETLERQVIVPIQEHNEMNITVGALIDKLNQIPEYREAAQRIYDRDFDAWVLTRSISAFERSLISQNSPFDQYYYGNDEKALTKSEIRGWKLFSEVLYCTECHAPPHFTNYKADCNGLYNDYGPDQGRFRIHHDSTDIGKFKVPTLRNIELTFPYMHDGSKWNLDDVIDHYAKGGEVHVNKSPIIKPFDITQRERKDLLNFLKALTDTTYMVKF